MNNLSDMVRQELAMAGFTECMNWSLLSQKDAADRPEGEKPNDDGISLEKAKGALNQRVTASLNLGNFFLDISVFFYRNNSLGYRGSCFLKC